MEEEVSQTSVAKDEPEETGEVGAHASRRVVELLEDGVTVGVTASGGGAGDVDDARPLVHHQYFVAVAEPRQILNHLHDGADGPKGRRRQ